MMDKKMRAAVEPLVWVRHWPGCFTVKSLKAVDNGCDVVYYAERAVQSKHVVNTVSKPGYFRCWIDFGEEFESLDAAKASAQADYEARILSAITLCTEAEVRAEAWAAALEAAALKMAKGGLHTVWDRSEAIRTLTPPADISAALDRIKADARAEGMREAAAIAKSRAGSPHYEPSSPYDRGYAAAIAEVERAILAAIPKSASETRETDNKGEMK